MAVCVVLVLRFCNVGFAKSVGPMSRRTLKRQHGGMAFSLAREFQGEEQNEEVAEEWNDKRQRHHLRGFGNEAHQQETASAYRCHHQQRRRALGEVAQAAQREREDGGEHYRLEDVVEYQGDHGHPA